MKTVIFLPGDEIIRQGDKGNKLYFISRGKVEIYLVPDGLTPPGNETIIAEKVLHKFNLENESKVYPPRLVRTLDEGAYFGEIALLTNLKRTATAKA